MNSITPEQFELLRENLLRSYSPHEVAEMLINHFTREEVDEHLEALCSCNKCRVCGQDNDDCIACEVEGLPCKCYQ